MKIVCEECGSTYKIKDDSIKGKTSIKTQCPKCKFIQKNNLVKAKESNPFEDNDRTIDFVQSLNIAKKNDSNNQLEFESTATIEDKKINLPKIDLKKLEEDESNQDNRFNDKDVAVQETPPKEEVAKGLYSAKKGSSFLGPYTLGEMKVKIEKRKVTKEFLFSKDGSNWESIEKYSELLPFFKKFKAQSNAGKYLLIGIVLIALAVLAIFLLENIAKDNGFISLSNSSNNSKSSALLHKYIQKWKEKSIDNNNNDVLIYSEAIQNFYQNSSDLYIKASSQFKEVLIKNHLKYDAFYYLVLTTSLAEVPIEDENTLRDYLKILKSIKNPKKHNELYYNALSALSFKLDKFVDSFNYAEATKNIVSNNAIANFLLAKFYFNSKKIKKTIKHLKISIKSDERLLIAKNSLAKTFLDSELYKEAVIFYEKKDSEFSKLILSKVYILVGNYEKSLKILKKLHKNPKRLVESDILYSKLLYQYKNNKSLALKILKKIEKEKLFSLANDKKILTLNHIAIIYRLSNNIPKSIKYSQKILSIDANNKFAIFSLAILRVKQKKYKEASILISRLESKKHKLGIEYKLVKFELFLAKKEYKNAIKEIKEIISLEKYNNLYHVFLANLMAKTNNLNLVQETILNLTNINPDYYINNYYKMSDLYIKSFSFKFLTNYLRKALKVKNTDKALILNNLGILEYQKKKFKKAIFYLKKSIELSERNISSYLYLAYAYFRVNNHKKVIETATIGHKFGKSEYLYLIELKTLLKTNKIDEAKRLINKAKYDFEYTYNTKLMRALVFIKEGKEEEAKNILLEIKDNFNKDLSFKKLLFSLSK